MGIDRFKLQMAYVMFYLADGVDPDGKRRPILVWDDNEETERISFFRISTKYNSNVPIKRNNYYEIQDWSGAGLSEPSWIDSSRLESMSHLLFNMGSSVGTLQPIDVIGFLDFVGDRQF